MTPAPPLFDAPDDQSAQQMLKTTLLRLACGGRKLAVLCGILLYISLIVPAFRHLRIASPQETGAIVFDLLYDFAGLMFVLLRPPGLIAMYVAHPYQRGSGIAPSVTQL